MKIFLLWYNDWEENTVLGIFETKEQAQVWKDYFIMYPHDGWYCPMQVGDEIEAQEDRGSRLKIEEREIGKLHPEIKIDNLKYLEFCEDKKNA
jgi:hypothetical protein